MSDKNRFKALLSQDSSNNKWNKKNRNNNNNNKFQNRQPNSRWQNNDRRNTFQSKRRNNKRFFGKNRVTPMNNDPDFKPNLVGRGEVSFIPQVRKGKQEKNKKKNKTIDKK